MALLPPNTKSYDTDALRTFVMVGILSPLVTIAVLLRFLARRITIAKLWWDDWLALISLLLFYVFEIVILLREYLLQSLEMCTDRFEASNTVAVTQILCYLFLSYQKI